MKMIPNRLKTRIVDIAAESHIGTVRKTNQDRFFLRAFADGTVFTAIVDGLGGVPAGDIAADLVVQALSRLDALCAGEEERLLANLAIRLDRVVEAAREGDPLMGGMGTTLILVWIKNGRAFWVHVGDSRLYLLRNRRLHQITRDQTLARFLLAEGEITPDQAKAHYSRQVMNQHLGCGYCEPETDGFTLTEGDLLLLSTDGLHQSVPKGQLERLLNGHTSTEDTVRALVKAALDAGGRDNITGVIVKMKSPAHPATHSGRQGLDDKKR
ncbi:MAG: protein phosphatase 2C domain-containing protein [Desulfobacteraceae bacterium]